MMSNISMVEAKLPPGFRFHPKDEELVCDYLMKKVTYSDSLLMIEVDLNKCEPWDIPQTACVGGRELYFYSQRDRKYATGIRTNRATASGYWKATGKDRPILRKDALVGMRKTLVFYQGRAPKGTKTDWVMHEFRLEGPLGTPGILTSQNKEDWVLCRVFYKSREGGHVSKQNNINNDETKTHNNNNNMGNICCSSFNDDTISSSSSLPALMDSYINFDQTQFDDHSGPTTSNINNHNNDNSNEQVPCFSIFSSTQISDNPSFYGPIINMVPTTTTTHTTCPSLYGQMIPMTTTSISINNNGTLVEEDPYSCDKKVIKAVLDHLTKMETTSGGDGNPIIKGSPPTLGEGNSRGYLSEVALSNIWSTHYN